MRVATQTPASAAASKKIIQHGGVFNTDHMEGFIKGRKTRTTAFPPFWTNGLLGGSVNHTDWIWVATLSNTGRV